MNNRLTPSQKARNERLIKELNQQLADGKITQKEYDRKIREIISR